MSQKHLLFAEKWENRYMHMHGPESQFFRIIDKAAPMEHGYPGHCSPKRQPISGDLMPCNRWMHLLCLHSLPAAMV